MAVRPAAREQVQKPPTPRHFGVLFSLMSSWIGQRHESAIAAFLAGIGEKRTFSDLAQLCRFDASVDVTTRLGALGSSDGKFAVELEESYDLMQ